MTEIKLLIVDDVEDNRLVLNAICRKMEGFVIQEACDGLEAVAMCESWQPHIVLMDVMMPNLDGFEASRIIKERFPETIIMVVTAVIDPQMEANMSSVGVAAYVHKPIDKELIRFKIKNFASMLRTKSGQHAKLSAKEALNPFCSDVRTFKTIFDIIDAEGMMDFGVWVLARCEQHRSLSCSKADPIIELFYELMRQGIREEDHISIIIEENFEELFITMKFNKSVVLKSKMEELVNDLQSHCIIRENVVCVRLGISGETIKPLISVAPSIEKPVIVKHEPPVRTTAPKEMIKAEVPSAPKEDVIAKESRTIDTQEQELLRQSFVNKTSAVHYVSDIGGDVLDEIRDLESLDEEWIERLQTLETEPTVENIRRFTDGVLGVYVKAINNLFEFTALAYALSSLGTFMKEHADAIVSDNSKLKMLVMLTEYLGSDLTSWREHIFSLQDAGDIHYLDSSFFSSCMQIEQIVGNKEINTDDDNDMEFF